MTNPVRVGMFASGTKTGGGSGFFNLERSWEFDAIITFVASNHEHGGVREKADLLKVPFEYMPGPFDAEQYRALIHKHAAHWVLLSGWLKKFAGFDAARTLNIHPALLSFDNGRFGGKGMYGH